MKTRRIRLNGTTFILGKKYRDTLLDIEGVASTGAQFLTGCDQLKLEGKDSTGRAYDHWVDVTRIGDVVLKVKKPGGPAPSIPSRHP